MRRRFLLAGAGAAEWWAKHRPTQTLIRNDTGRSTELAAAAPGRGFAFRLVSADPAPSSQPCNGALANAVGCVPSRDTTPSAVRTLACPAVLTGPSFTRFAIVLLAPLGALYADGGPTPGIRMVLAEDLGKVGGWVPRNDSGEMVDLAADQTNIVEELTSALTVFRDKGHTRPEIYTSCETLRHAGLCLDRV